ncbi:MULTISPECIES: flavoprotein [Actinomadura]|uniref:Flavoprotein n=1 Tax=Actinomadura yumaensis TaxID=111807 RepID=A0ABW2CRQ3_9ACTN|nr:flavoprotein [Actinomadura sp. J1-007]MWK39788.1 flavoprotein [Actinomadura sp. J1-007]
MTHDRVLYLICCGSPGARDAHTMVELAQAQGWTVCVLTTPYGRRFVDVPRLEKLTGHPVRSDYKQPDEPDVLPMPTALAVAPATVNTINKWAAGICDTVPLGYLVEAHGLGLPTVALPYSNQAHLSHPKFQENVAALRSWGVTVLTGTDLPEDHALRGGPSTTIPWQLILDALPPA